VSILKTLFSSNDVTPKSDTEVTDTKAFDAANAAIDRAIAERQASDAERRLNEPNRRNGLADTRPPGAPDRRSSSQPNFGRRRTPE
jgi:hypothetical protein